ncbi:MAG TPA: hypothetical protein PLI70_06110 [Gemmatimonadales bacterium]|nr:hypothetical protein [Gemmatimonadales bacterium]HRZ10337.1 hypothetical protein [Gemmatimonadales bacterium]
MPTPPPCKSLGRQCRSLEVTLRIGKIEEGLESLDHEATWLLGHTAQLDFGRLRTRNGELLVDARLHVPCKHLKEDGNRARCDAHGFRGPSPARPRRPAQPRQLGGNRFLLVDQRRLVNRPAVDVKAGLPVLGTNPCLGAPCRTADHTRGAACCRDLQVEIMCTREETRLEALVRARQSPYLCKTERNEDDSIEAEMISACGYLGKDGVACSLHGRVREDGRPAKPDLCSEWPEGGDLMHPGCVFRK